MAVIRIENGFRVTLPESVRNGLCVGDELMAHRDEFGQIILTPRSTIQEALGTTFGMWADRTDIPKDGVEYVNQIRSGERFDEIRKRLHEAT